MSRDSNLNAPCFGKGNSFGLPWFLTICANLILSYWFHLLSFCRNLFFPSVQNIGAVLFRYPPSCMSGLIKKTTKHTPMKCHNWIQSSHKNGLNWIQLRNSNPFAKSSLWTSLWSCNLLKTSKMWRLKWCFFGWEKWGPVKSTPTKTKKGWLFFSISIWAVKKKLFWKTGSLLHAFLQSPLVFHPPQKNYFGPTNQKHLKLSSFFSPTFTSFSSMFEGRSSILKAEGVSLGAKTHWRAHLLWHWKSYSVAALRNFAAWNRLENNAK